MEDTFLNRPTTKFLAPGFATQEPFDLASTLPLRDPRNTAIFLDGDNVKGFNLLRELYPNAQSELRTASFGGPVALRSVFIPRDQISSIQGLVARYYRGGQPSEEPAITSRVTALDFDWALGTPIPPPFYAEWRGTLVVPTYGRYELELIGPAGLTLSIDETEVLTGGQTRSKVLALGTHPIAIHGVVDQATPVRLTWQTPGQAKASPRARCAIHAPSKGQGTSWPLLPGSWLAGPAEARTNRSQPEHQISSAPTLSLTL